MAELTGEHAFVHENMAAYLAGGLDAAERGRFDGHVNNCPECFDALSEARDADRGLQRALAELVPGEEGGGFEERMGERVRRVIRWRHPAIRRVGYATAAAVALAATGVFANVVMRQDGRFNNPLTQALASHADAQDTEWGKANQALTGKFRANEPQGGDELKDLNVKWAAAHSQYGAEAGPLVIAGETTQTELSRTSNDRNQNAAGIRRSKVATLLTDAEKLYDATQFKESADLLRQATVIDPQDQNAALMLRLVTDKINDRAFDSVTHRTGEEVIRQEIDRSEHLIPYADLMVYPDNWREITRKGAGGGMTSNAPASFADDVYKRDADRPGQPGGPVSERDVVHGLAAGEKAAGPVYGTSKVSDPTLTLNGTTVARSSGSGNGAYPDVTSAVHESTTRTPAAPQDVGGAALAYNGKAKSNDVAFGFGVNDALKQNVNINGNNLTLGLLGSPDSGITGNPNRNELEKTFAVRDEITMSSFGAYAPRVNLSGMDEKNKAGKDGGFGGGSGGFGNGGGFDKTGVGTLTANGTGSYSGVVNITGGTLTTSKGLVASGPTSSVTLNSIKVDAADKSGIDGTSSDDPAAKGRVGRFSVTETDFDKGNDDGKKPENRAVSPGRFATDISQGPAVDVPEMKLTRDFVESTALELGKPLSADAQRELTRRVAPVGTLDLKWQEDVRFWNVLSGDTNALALATPGNGAPAGSSGGGSATSNAPAPGNGAPTAEIQALKIIRNGTITFEVLSFDEAYQHVRQIAIMEKGYVASTSSDKLANGHVRGTIVVRVPPERLEEFLISLRSLGDLKAQQIGAADVTKDYYDIESELRGLTTMETRLLELAKNPNGQVKDLAEVERQLGETRVRIEKLKGQMGYYNNLVSLATITITAYEKDIASPTAASQQENVNVNVETEQVEEKYTSARKAFEDAGGHIVESQLKNSDADHVAAHIVADVPPGKSDFVANQLKQLGKVASFNRDRKQTTTGGTGAPIPGVQVEEKETHFTVDLFNLANLNPRETTVLNVAVKDVEASYKSLLEVIKQPVGEAPPPAPAAAAAGAAAPAAAAVPGGLVGHVNSSNLTGQLPEQMYADINAQVRSENADAVLAALKNAGVVISSQLNTNQDPTGTTAAKRGIQVRIVNIAMVSPKEFDTIKIAVRDVDAASKATLALIRKDAPLAAPPAGTPGAAELMLLPPMVGRVMTAVTNGDQPLTMQADIQAQIRVDQDADLLAAIRKMGEVVSSKTGENAETIGTTRAKRGLVVHFVNEANVQVGERQQLHAVSANVADSYRTLNGTLEDMAKRGEVRIIDARYSDDPRQATASLAFVAEKTAVPAVEKAFTAAGLEFSSRTVTHAADASEALDSKVGFVIDNISAAVALDPRRTITLSTEVSNVSDAVSTLRKSVQSLGASAHESDFTMTHDGDAVKAHMVIDAYVTATPALMSGIDSLGGAQKNYQEINNSQAPETRSFTKNRIDLWITSKPVELPKATRPDQSMGSSISAALSSAAGALLYSLYLVLTGVLFVGPFALVAWVIWAVMKRRKGVKG